jgi:hypothetical protein
MALNSGGYKFAHILQHIQKPGELLWFKKEQTHAGVI